jgi:glycosyltransferase involved in cell wall biosynthesis
VTEKDALMLSVVIPAHNEAACLWSTVDGIARELEGAGIDYEVLVIDDASTDSTEDVV